MKIRSLTTACVRALYLFALLLVSFAAHAQSFTIAANPAAVTVYPGQTQVPINVSVSSSTYTGAISVTLSGLPSGITITSSPLTLQAGGSGTILLNVSPNADQEAFPASSPSNTNTATTPVSVVGAVGSTTVTSPLALTVSLSNENYAPTPNQINLPIVSINTNGVPIKDGTTDVPGTITITSADGQTSYLPNSGDTDNTADFHWHGNTTVLMPKKPYHIKLNTSLDLMQTLGVSCPYVTNGKAKPVCDKSKSYVLLANYDDKTLLRDWSASALANAIPYGGDYLDQTPVPAGFAGVIPTPSGTAAHMPWAPHSIFVELYVNGAYEGNYQLIEQIKVDSHRINISELAETDINDDITGGYLLEIDQHKDSAFIFTTPQGLPIGLIDPDYSPDPEVPEQTSYISNYVDTAENALFSSNFTDPNAGWRAYFDEASAVNFYLVNDIMGNVDGGNFYSSTYVYKAIDNPFLYMGPIWDFDISSGNVNYEPIDNPTVPWMQVNAPWYAQWFKDPAFKADVVKQFNTLKSKGVLSSWIASVAAQSQTLEQSQANNFARWPMLGIKVWPNPQAAGSYDAEVQYLTNFLNLRVAYLDSLFNGKQQTATTLTPLKGTIYLGSSQTLTAHVTGGTTPTGAVSFFNGNVVVGTAALDGSGTATLTTTNLRLGTYSLSAVYNGDTTNALSSSTATNITVVQQPAQTATSLSASASNVAAGTPVTLSVSVASNNGTSTPSGPVAFTANGVALGTATLNGGVCGLSTTKLTTGTNYVQANYSGDSTHQGSSSAISTVVITAGGVQVTLGTNPAGITYTLDGASYGTQQAFSLAPSSTHTIAVASPQTASGTQSTFVSWSDGGAASHTITIPTGGAAYTATFTNAYQLTTTASPSAYGTVSATPPAGSGYYASGTVVSLTATPNAGYVFSGWTGSVANASSATTTITMTAPQSVTAMFAPSGAGIGLGNGFTPGSTTLNGTAALSGTRLRLTDGATYKAASAFFGSAVNVQAFTNDFTFQLSNANADGFMFVIQNQTPAALGGLGVDLGFGSGTAGIQKSVGIKFDLYSNSGEGPNSTGLFLNGARPTTPSIDLTPSGIDLHSGDTFRVHMTYSATTLSVTLTDTVTGAQSMQTYTVNIPSIIGGNSAYIGFTAGTGGASATQDILGWNFAPGVVQGVVSPSFSPAGGTFSTAQQVTLNDADAGAVIYYTLDGTTPTVSSTQYTSPLTIGSTTTIRAVAALNGAVSPVSSATYTIYNSSGGVSFGSGFSAGAMTLNGSSTLSGSRLRLTNDGRYQAASAFYPSVVDVHSFTNDFTFQITDASADGFMFVLQNQAASALGGYGVNLGFGSGIQRSVGIKFDLYNNAGEGSNSTGIFKNGALPTLPSTDLTPGGINLHSGDVFRVHMSYDGVTLTVVVTDTKTGAQAVQSYKIDLPATVGSGAAYVGFTAGTGGAVATQDILTWEYTPGVSTAVVSPAFSPAGGTYATAPTVTLSDATTGAAIYYTLDGTTPTTSSTQYSGPFTIDATTTVKAIAALNGVTSPVSSATYTLYSSNAGVNLSNGFTAGSTSLNGIAALSGTKLRLTNGSTYKAASAFYPSIVNVKAFTNDFTFQLTNAAADGFMFVIQNQGASALGGLGIDLGFGSGSTAIQNAVGIKFDLYNNAGEGADSTGIYTNGARPTQPSTDLSTTGIDLHSGDLFKTHMVYDGTTLTVTIIDTVTNAQATQSYTVDIPSMVGASAAYVGFTAGTGGASATQDILNWSFSPQ